MGTIELTSAPEPDVGSFIVGGGRMARLVRDFDWSQTDLGPLADWGPELKSAVSLVLESRFPAAIVWGPGLTTIYNDAFCPILGQKPQALGRSFADIWAEAWEEIGPIAARAMAGEATYIEDFPLLIDRSGRMEQAWFTFCYSPLRLADGTVAGMMDTVMETTTTVRARTELRTLNHELGHRLKNTLATVQAIAAQTLRGVSEQEAVSALSERLVAMGQAHDVLLKRNWTGGYVLQVAEAALSSFGGPGQTRISGPDVEIGPRATMALSMALHELATNAAKYGALSTTTGEVTLEWSVDDDFLRLRWRERGGPPVSEPTRRGFGSRLLDMGLCPGGQVSRRYAPEGFEADVDAPLAELADPFEIAGQRLR